VGRVTGLPCGGVAVIRTDGRETAGPVVLVNVVFEIPPATMAYQP